MSGCTSRASLPSDVATSTSFHSSEKLAITADSADKRARAEEIRNKAKSQLRYGQRKLCETNLKDDRKEINAAPWSERVFSVSGWEHSCSLAERATYQLDASSQ